MHISQIIIRNYRCLREADVTLNPELNIIVGNNECGKSTLLEAVHLALTGQLNGRPIQTELHPHLFNSDAVDDYIAALMKSETLAPPLILIELYFPDDPSLAKLKGTNNSLRKDVPGVAFSIEPNQDYADEFNSYITDPSIMRTLPIEYYLPRWRGFTDNGITSSRSIPIKSAFIDASIIRNNTAASRYIVDVVRESLTPDQKVDLALSYRLMKDNFLLRTEVKEVNEALLAKKGDISDKALSISLDTSSRSTWEAGVMPYLDDVPLTLVGKGEQNSIKIKLAMETNATSHLILIEEAENYLSYSNLNMLVRQIAERRGSRQLIITTHSSFVLNKLGIGSVVLFRRGHSFRLCDLPSGTQDYFMRLPGHDTLRLILAKRSILVEGPSDELIVQAAFNKTYGKLPLEAGIDVISVNALAFKRFLDIAIHFDHKVAVVTDNDGSVLDLERKYADYLCHPQITIFYSKDETCPTLEYHLLNTNGRRQVEKILDKSFANDEALLAYMSRNKTDVALRFFSTAESWDVPGYIVNAIS